jgi:hypothetical protein
VPQVNIRLCNTERFISGSVKNRHGFGCRDIQKRGETTGAVELRGDAQAK